MRAYLNERNCFGLADALQTDAHKIVEESFTAHTLAWQGRRAESVQIPFVSRTLFSTDAERNTPRLSAAEPR